MTGALASHDAVTAVLHGGSSDIVPVSPCYEFLGPLKFHRMELRWGKWRDRLAEARTDVLTIDYGSYFQVELEVFMDILTDVYPRPAWSHLPKIQVPENVLGSAVVRQGEDLYWLSPNGMARWIPPHRKAHHEAEVADRSMPWAGLWDGSRDTPSALREAASRPAHDLEPIPEPEAEQATAVAGSQRYDLARSLARTYRDQLPMYTGGTTPYDGLLYLLGFRHLMSALVERPKLVHRILENRLPVPSAELAAERLLGINLMFIEETMASADIISPQMYREFAWPYDKHAIEMYEGMGFRTVLYFSGNLMPLLEDLNELPFTALAFEENRKDYGIDLAEVRRALPEKVIFGNVDALWLEHASDDEVMKEVSRQVSLAGPENFVLSVGSPFTPGTSLERIRFFCESTRRL